MPPNFPLMILKVGPFTSATQGPHKEGSCYCVTSPAYGLASNKCSLTQ